MRILVCGSRDWKDSRRIWEALYNYPHDSTMIHGGARGADRLAAEQADYYGMEVIPYPADWDKHGKAAGPIRNQQMLTEGKPDVVLAFRSSGESRGTDHMISISRKAGIPVEIYHADGKIERIGFDSNTGASSDEAEAVN